jgi:hypothetical protein
MSATLRKNERSVSPVNDAKKNKKKITVQEEEALE